MTHNYCSITRCSTYGHLWVSYGVGGCAWCKAVAYREQVHFVGIKDMSMGVRGVSVGMVMDAPG